MRVPAKVYTAGPLGPVDDVFCRVHSKINTVGDLAGTSLAYAERAETTPKLIFLISEHEPARGSVYAIQAGEVYRVDSVEPTDGITRTAICVRVTTADAVNYPSPVTT